MPLIDTNWLEKNLNKVKIIDASWHMPNANRNGYDEYNKEHLPNAIFFDLDKNSKIDTITLNLGGVANLSYIPKNGIRSHVKGFDTGPGNALLDDFMKFRLGKKQDTGGELALTGNVDQVSLSKLLSHSYFLEKAPKSLDRNEFDLTSMFGMDEMFDDAVALSDENKCAIHTEFSSNQRWPYDWGNYC